MSKIMLDNFKEIYFVKNTGDFDKLELSSK